MFIILYCESLKTENSIKIGLQIKLYFINSEMSYNLAKFTLDLRKGTCANYKGTWGWFVQWVQFENSETLNK